MLMNSMDNGWLLCDVCWVFFVSIVLNVLWLLRFVSELVCVSWYSFDFVFCWCFSLCDSVSEFYVMNVVNRFISMMVYIVWCCYDV